MPLLADLKPSGKYVMEDLHDVGGTPAVMKMLLGEGLLDGDCMTVTGKTLAREPGGSAGPRSRVRRSCIRSTSRSKPPATSASCAATSPRRRRRQDHRQRRPALHRPGQRLRLRRRHAARAGAKEIEKGDVRRHPLRRPQGRPRHAGDAHADLRHHGRRPRQRRRPDHRRPLLRRLARLHRRPRHARSAGRRPDRAGRNGDIITIDAEKNEISCRRLATTNWQRARKAWKMPPYKATRGTLYKYIKNVKSASEGCVTDE